MDAATQQGCDMKITTGQSPKRIYLTVEVDSIVGVVMAVIRQGGLKQVAIAEALSMTKDAFSKKFNRPEDCFYTALLQLEKIMSVTGQIAPIEFWAAQHGYELKRKNEPPAVDDATGGTGLRKP